MTLAEIASPYFHAFAGERRLIVTLRTDTPLEGDMHHFTDWLLNNSPTWQGEPLSCRSLAHPQAPLYREKISVQEFIRQLEEDYIEWFFHE